jgi:hypothetical protein
MKITLITPITPYKENIRGVSALPYHLLIHREQVHEKIDIEIFSFNINQLSKDQISESEEKLNVRIHILKERQWIRWMFLSRLHPIVRIFMSRPFSSYVRLKQKELDKIQACNPDGIWIYGEEYAPLLKQFPNYRRILLGPDSEGLYYYRLLGQRFIFKDTRNLFRKFLMYPKYLKIEQEFPADNSIIYCLVGKADANFLQKVNPYIQARFLRHPHYDVNQVKEIKFHTPIRLLIAGQNNFYMQQGVEEWFSDMLSHSSALKAHYTITFLGRGWEEAVQQLSNGGYNVAHIPFAANYTEEVQKHDIQLTPIIIGTGTKGKVLDALSNGLLVIGTEYALENISVENGISCLQYKHSKEIIELLKSILENPLHYEKIAKEGRKNVLKHHSRRLISKEFFQLFNL